METKQGSKNKKWWKVFLGISAATIVAAGTTVGICYAVFHKTNTTPVSDKITFNNYSAAMTSGSQIISAASSEGKTVTLTASGSGQDSAWTFINNTLNYETVTSQTTVTIKADDTITNQSILICCQKQKLHLMYHVLIQI